MPVPVPYARLAHEQLAAAGIALNGAAVMPLTSRLVGRTLLGLFALPAADSAGKTSSPGWPGAACGRTVAGSRSRPGNGCRVRRAWWPDETTGTAGLATFADDREAEAEAAEKDPDAPEWRAERARTTAERARALREFVLGLIDDAAQAAAHPQPWGERVAWARGHVRSLFGDERRRSAWPTVEQKAAERVERALDRLACLDAVEESVDLDVFTRTLELELETDLGRVGRMGEGVLVGSVSMGVGLDLDLVVVLGLAEGLFPSPTRDDSLLPDHERRPPATNCPCGPRAWSASTANSWPRWPAHAARCCASHVATCAATWSGSPPVGSSRSPVPWPESGGGRTSS